MQGPRFETRKIADSQAREAAVVPLGAWAATPSGSINSHSPLETFLLQTDGPLQEEGLSGFLSRFEPLSLLHFCTPVRAGPA